MRKANPPDSSKQAESIASSAISVRFLVPMFRYLRPKHSEVANKCIEVFQLDETQLESEENIPTETFFQILEYVSEQCSDPCFGMHIYEELDFNCLGILGYALTNSDSVGTALDLLNRYYRLYHSGAELLTEVHGEQVVFSYRILAPGISYSRQDSENSMMFLPYLIRRLAIENWRPEEAHFQHAEPENTKEHKRLLCHKLKFNQPLNKLVFKKSDLNLPITDANSHLFKTLEDTLDKINKIYDGSNDSIIDKVQYEIVSSLPDYLPTIDDIASRINLGLRTLQRRLSDEGYSFSQILDKTRLSLATHYLSNTEITITEIAFLLGYSESSPFERAFKRWTKQTPSEYRKEVLNRL
jgi:AraC-like DNA-binding protein